MATIVDMFQSVCWTYN